MNAAHSACRTALPTLALLGVTAGSLLYSYALRKENVRLRAKCSKQRKMLSARSAERFDKIEADLSTLSIRLDEKLKQTVNKELAS